MSFATVLVLATLTQMVLGGSIAPPAVVGGTYLNCYSDNTLTGKTFIFLLNNSPALCVKACAGAGYSYAGLTNGVTCNCGNTAPSITATTCGMPCSDLSVDPNYKCGGIIGVNSLNVYQVTSVNKYVGCYKNTWFPFTVLPTLKYLLDLNNKPSYCISQCAGFQYAGVMCGTKCFCGNTINANKVPNELCDWNCNADNSYKCGGGFVMDVYTVA